MIDEDAIETLRGRRRSRPVLGGSGMELVLGPRGVFPRQLQGDGVLLDRHDLGVALRQEARKEADAAVEINQ